MSLTVYPVPKNFKPLSRSAWRYANRNNIMIRKLGPKQKKWVDALLSGKFKKAKAHLCASDCKGQEYHCCLGVACELVPKINKEKLENNISIPCVQTQNNFNISNVTLFDQNEGDLPDIAVNYFDFHDQNGFTQNDWCDDFKTRDNFRGEFTECNSLDEIRRYIKTFERVISLKIDGLTDMNDGVDVWEDFRKESKRVIYSHRQIANFVRAYPQAIFCSSV